MTLAQEDDSEPSDREDTPLLPQGREAGNEPSHFPLGQILCLLFLQLIEPLTANTILPFTPEMVRKFHISHGDDDVGYFVGLIQSSFFAAQAAMVFFWCNLSDIIGRRPVLGIGLTGITISMISFGFARSFWALLLSRSLCGALNGNSAVMKAMVAEIAGPSNMVRVFSILPLAWSTGAILGPLIGGVLANPNERFPGLFGNFSLTREYPYLLPCCVAALFSVGAIAVAIFLVNETVQHPTPLRTLLISPFGGSSVLKQGDVEEDRIPLNLKKPRPPLRQLLTRQVVICTLNYALLAFNDVMFRCIQPLFMFTPVDIGGLGLDPASIGAMIAPLGLMNALVQIFGFTHAHRLLGGKRLFIFGASTAIPTFAAFPLMNVLARNLGAQHWSIPFTSTLQLAIYTLFNMSYGCMFVFIASAAPERELSGATNGIAQLAVCIMRAIGPSLANSLFSFSISSSILGGWLVWYVLLLSGAAGAMVGLLL